MDVGNGYWTLKYVVFFIGGIFVCSIPFILIMCDEDIFPQGGTKHLNTFTKHSILFDVKLMLLKIPQNKWLCDTSPNSLACQNLP